MEAVLMKLQMERRWIVGPSWTPLGDLAGEGPGEHDYDRSGGSPTDGL